MSKDSPIYVWRCVKCSNHFSNIVMIDGALEQEKKCPKCKSINCLNITNNKISLTCRAAPPDFAPNPEENQDYN